jgi:hypothetical protein
MSADNLIPISDEQAKLVHEFLDIFGDLPKDLVGLLAGDRVKVARAERLAILWANAKKRLEDRGIAHPEPPSLKLALPILDAAADENNQELQDLWASLLAAAMDPKRRDWVRQSFIQIVKQLDPFDVLVLKAIADNGGAQWSPNGRNAIMARTQGSMSDVLASFGHLEKLDCIYFAGAASPKINPYLTPLGTLLMNTVSG